MSPQEKTRKSLYNKPFKKAKRLVDVSDVVILLDSITRLARAHNTVAPASGKYFRWCGSQCHAETQTISLGLPVRSKMAALSLSATALIDTGSKMDEVIFEEFRVL